MATDRVVALVDMDCFYCQVETRINPDLKGKPSAVVQYKDWKGGGIIAVNYEARAFGVTRNMRGDEAKEKCADIVLVRVPEVRGKADLTKYRDAGKEVIQVFLQFGAVVERASIDEAYIDLTSLVNQRMAGQNMKVEAGQIDNTFVVGHEENREPWLKDIYEGQDGLKTDNIRLAIGAAIVEEMRSQVFQQTSFRCSAGIAHNKVLAKLCAGLHKPNKQTLLPQDQVPKFFENVKIGKVRGLGGKLGDHVTEALKCETMGQLANFSLLELRRHFDEKTTNWLFNLSRGIEYEAVTERDLPKSIGCSKNFRGPEILDTKAKVEKWMGNLCEEVAERLAKDRDENDRVAKNITVSISQEKIHGQVTRSGPLFSYDAEKIARQALHLIAKTNEAQDDFSWKPKLRNISISASKFGTHEASNIQSYFQASDAKEEPKETIIQACQGPDEAQESEPQNCDQINEENTNEFPEEEEQNEEEVTPEPELELCEKCNQRISPFEMPEHLDFHLAKELQAQLRRDERQQPSTMTKPSITSNPGSKRKIQPSTSQKQIECKKQKTISSFFTKK